MNADSTVVEIVCVQKGCGRPARHVGIWPGRGDLHYCDACAPKVANIARSMGFDARLRPFEQGPADRTGQTQRLTATPQWIARDLVRLARAARTSEELADVERMIVGYLTR